MSYDKPRGNGPVVWCRECGKQNSPPPHIGRWTPDSGKRALKRKCHSGLCDLVYQSYIDTAGILRAIAKSQET
jgi:hypothetical protein